MTLFPGLLAVALGLGVAAASATALTCAPWTRLGPDQRLAQLRELIEEVAGRPDPEGIQVDRGALRRCLEASASSIADAFDDACSRGLEADLDALDEIFRRYVASCQG